MSTTVRLRTVAGGPTPAGWRVNPNSAHVDPLLDCLVAIARLHGRTTSAEALGAGLPREGNLLPVSQLARAGDRVGLTVRVVRRELAAIPARLLPAILLLKDSRACVLLEGQGDGVLRLIDPEAPEGTSDVTQEELAAEYAGALCTVTPRYRFDARTPEVGRVRERHWFWGAIYDNWRYYRDALLAALLLNLFGLAVPLFSMNVYDRVVPNHALETLWVLALGAILVLSFDFILRTLRAWIVDAASKRIDISLSARIMERVLGLKMAARPASVGAFAANLRAFESVRDFITSATVTAVIDLPFTLFFVLVLAWIAVPLIFPVLIGAVLVIAVAWVTQARMHALVESSYRANAQRNATLIESLVGLETLKTLAAESQTQRKWEEATRFLARVGAQTRLLSAITVNFSFLMQQIVSVTVVVVGVYLLADKAMSMGGIIAAAMLASRAMSPLGQVAGLLMQYQNARTSLSTLENQMALPVEREASFLHRSEFHGAIEFSNVTFAYSEREQPVLKDVSFKLAVGEKAAIIGRIGSGKTTIEKLVLGLYHANSGAVLIDGIDARQIDPAELRRAIGFVPQDVNLFYGSLRENIAMGSPFADDEAILTASEIAGVTEFANVHPKGFDMLIGERGESLSGGQRQAVAIARALLNDPPMLVFDEPTSSMDHQSEEAFKRRLRERLRDRTLLLVTHRTSLLDLVDRLIVIDNGRVVADGPKAEVMEALQQGRVGRAR